MVTARADKKKFGHDTHPISLNLHRKERIFFVFVFGDGTYILL